MYIYISHTMYKASRRVASRVRAQQYTHGFTRGSLSSAVAYADIAAECNVPALDRSLAGDHSLGSCQFGFTYVTAASHVREARANAKAKAATMARAMRAMM